MEKKAHQEEYKTITTKILSIHKGKDSVKQIEPGVSISIETTLEPSLTKTDSLTGCVAGLKGTLPEITDILKIKAQLFDEVLGIQEHKDIEPIKTKETLMLNVNTTITVGTVEKISGP